MSGRLRIFNFSAFGKEFFSFFVACIAYQLWTNVRWKVVYSITSKYWSSYNRLYFIRKMNIDSMDISFQYSCKLEDCTRIFFLHSSCCSLYNISWNTINCMSVACHTSINSCLMTHYIVTDTSSHYYVTLQLTTGNIHIWTKMKKRNRQKIQVAVNARNCLLNFNYM
jgi:hypothetical protein